MPITKNASRCGRWRDVDHSLWSRYRVLAVTLPAVVIALLDSWTSRPEIPSETPRMAIVVF